MGTKSSDAYMIPLPPPPPGNAWLVIWCGEFWPYVTDKYELIALLAWQDVFMQHGFCTGTSPWENLTQDKKSSKYWERND